MSISFLSIKKNSTVSKNAKVLSFCKIYSSRVGDYTYIGRRSIIAHVEIGKYCSIASNSIIGVANHPLSFVSTSPLFYSKKNIFNKCYIEKEFNEYEKTIIGNDVWIGANCIIKSGVNIGTGAVIGAGAVVTKDVRPYSIVGGVPAKEIKKRFTDSQIKQLMQSEWWNWSEEKLNLSSNCFHDINKFILQCTEKGDMYENSDTNFHISSAR